MDLQQKDLLYLTRHEQVILTNKTEQTNNLNWWTLHINLNNLSQPINYSTYTHKSLQFVP
jgi:hypothetical protein